jgi:hypothetical protein
MRDGKRLVTDGSFPIPGEQLGGIYWIEAENLDEALSIAERIPSARRAGGRLKYVACRRRNTRG